MDTNTNEIKYDAFISYRHCELDKFVAEELHKQLETFKIPKKIAKKIGKKKISRIFRDKDELPITSNLADPIISALKVSNFLIVICSPRLNDSLWCKREIENFIAMHGQDKVLAVLVEGEPDESFPPELLYREKTITLENGEKMVIKEPVEPLAADVRGKNKKEIRKNIKIEMLRLLAPMLNCNYDDLRQRHKERKMHRILAIAGLVSVVGIAFGTISTIMAMRIQEQKEQIDAQYWEALETNAQMASKNALELLDKGDRIGAIELSRSLLPDSLENQDIPYTPEAYFALTQSVNPYAVGDILSPVYQIKANAKIDDMVLSPDKSKLYTLTKYSQLTVWDMVNEKRCMQLNLEEIFEQSIYDSDITFVGEDKIAILTWDSIEIIKLNENEAGEVASSIPIDDYEYFYQIYSDKSGKYIAINSGDCICIFDVESEKQIYQYDAKENKSISYTMKFYSDEQIIFCEVSEEEGNETIDIFIANVESGEVTNSYQIPSGTLADVQANEEALFVAVNELKEYDGDSFDLYGDATVYCFDLSSYDGKKWEYVLSETLVNSMVVPYPDDTYFLAESYAKITVLDKNTGQWVTESNFGSEIVKIFQLVSPNSYVVFTRAGEYATFLPEKELCLTVEGRFVSATDNIKEFDGGNDYMVSLSYSSKELIVYEWYEAPQMEIVMENEGYIYRTTTTATKCEDGIYSAYELGNGMVNILDHEDKSVVAQIEITDYIDYMHFVDGKYLQIVCDQDVYVYDVQGQLVSSVQLGDDYAYVSGVSVDGKYAFMDDYNDMLYVVECSSGEVVKEMAMEEMGIDGDDTYTFSNNADKCVILDKLEGKCKLYNVLEESMIQSIDINATYVSSILFSENDSYIYIIYEDGFVEQYLSEDMTLKCTVEDLEQETESIRQITIDGEDKYYFISISGAYVLGEYDGVLKVEQFVPNLEIVDTHNQLYWITSSMGEYNLYTFPIYTYEEMLGKADQICYDNSIWNNE